MLFFPMQQKKNICETSLKNCSWTNTDLHGPSHLSVDATTHFSGGETVVLLQILLWLVSTGAGKCPSSIPRLWGKHFEFSFHKSTIGNFHSLPLSVYTIKEPLPRLHAVAHSKSAGMFPIPIPTQSIGHGSSFTGMKTRMYFTCKSRHLGISISYFPGNTLKYIDLMWTFSLSKNLIKQTLFDFLLEQSYLLCGLDLVLMYNPFSCRTRECNSFSCTQKPFPEQTW